MTRFTITAPPVPPRGKVVLPRAKSILIRRMAIDFLQDRPLSLPPGPRAEDVMAMHRVLTTLRGGTGGILDAGEAATVARFALALAAITPGQWVLTGRGRLPRRPFAPLLMALRQWGVSVEWKGSEGRLPIIVTGRPRIRPVPIGIRGDVSSQFISALALLALKADAPLTIRLETPLVSAPYLHLTLTMLERAGIRHRWEGTTLILRHPPSAPTPPVQGHPERDWSAALFFLATVVANPQSAFTFPDLSIAALQGDARIALWLKAAGLLTITENNGALHVRGGAGSWSEAVRDLRDMPDAVLPLAVGLSLRRQPFAFSGIEHLQYKESNRLSILKGILSALNMEVRLREGVLSARPVGPLPSSLRFNTARDHRVAMLAAPLSAKIPHVMIDDLACVQKSFPTFWGVLQSLGWIILPQ